MSKYLDQREGLPRFRYELANCLKVLMATRAPEGYVFGKRPLENELETAITRVGSYLAPGLAYLFEVASGRLKRSKTPFTGDGALTVALFCRSYWSLSRPTYWGPYADDLVQYLKAKIFIIHMFSGCEDDVLSGELDQQVGRLLLSEDKFEANPWRCGK